MEKLVARLYQVCSMYSPAELVKARELARNPDAGLAEKTYLQTLEAQVRETPVATILTLQRDDKLQGDISVILASLKMTDHIPMDASQMYSLGEVHFEDDTYQATTFSALAYAEKYGGKYKPIQDVQTVTFPTDQAAFHQQAMLLEYAQRQTAQERFMPKPTTPKP